MPQSAKPLIGLPWYHAKDWTRIKAMMADSSILHDHYEEWLASAEEIRLELEGEGFPVVKVYIEPSTFADWCRIKGRKADAKARSEFAGDFARLEVKA